LSLKARADARESYAYNEWLSQKRIIEIMNYMTARGIVKERMEGKAFGEIAIVNKCMDGVFCTEAEHQVNRRVEFVVDWL
jgi:outer membrane protein OmpA-like peptidoglycan-associated protein